MKLTTNFSLEEFRCKDKAKTPVPANLIPNVQKLANNLQALRDHIGKPIKIVSGYRTPAHNAKVGGVKSSQHLLAKASDIRVDGMTPRQVANEIESLITQGKMMAGGIGIYPSFVHYDIRGKNARW